MKFRIGFYELYLQISGCISPCYNILLEPTLLSRAVTAKSSIAQAHTVSVEDVQISYCSLYTISYHNHKAISSSGSATTPSSLQISKNYKTWSVMPTWSIVMNLLWRIERLHPRWSLSGRLQKEESPTTEVVHASELLVDHPPHSSFR